MAEPTEPEPTEQSDDSQMLKQLPILVAIILALLLVTGWAFKGESNDASRNQNPLAPKVNAFGYNGARVTRIQIKDMNTKSTPIHEITDAESISRILGAMAVTSCEPVPGENGWRLRLFSGEKRIAALYVLPDGHWGMRGHYGRAPQLCIELQSAISRKANPDKAAKEKQNDQ